MTPVSGTIPMSVDLGTVAQTSRNQVDVFNSLYSTFVVLGTVVGVIVISYVLYNAYKYRASAPNAEGQYDIEEEAEDESDVARPRLGEVPTGAGKGGGKKLFMSFAISAVIVLSLVVFAYFNLLYVEGAADQDSANALDIGVEANQYGYTYTYPSGNTTSASGEGLVVPEGRTISINATSCHPGECGDYGRGNVWHTWSSQELRASADAMPGQYTETWFQADEPGTYRVQCQELCGAGHSTMNFDEGVVVKEPSEFKTWCLNNSCMDEERLNTWLNETGGEN
jgi:cytochrome c oxidase subunit 2